MAITKSGVVARDSDPVASIARKGVRRYRAISSRGPIAVMQVRYGSLTAREARAMVERGLATKGAWGYELTAYGIDVRDKRAGVKECRS